MVSDSVRAITDQSGKVVFNADYFAFGVRYISNGDFDEKLGFTEKEYDPETGRFIGEDPAADPNNPNLYSYCGNNPTIRTDPSGELLAELLITAFVPWLFKGLEYGLNAPDFWSGLAYGLANTPIFFGIPPSGNNDANYIDPKIDLSSIYSYGETGGISIPIEGYDDDYWYDYFYTPLEYLPLYYPEIPSEPNGLKQLPNNGPGYGSYLRDPKGDDNWGKPEFVAALMDLASSLCEYSV